MSDELQRLLGTMTAQIDSMMRRVTRIENGILGVLSLVATTVIIALLRQLGVF